MATTWGLHDVPGEWEEGRGEGSVCWAYAAAAQCSIKLNVQPSKP